MLAKKTWIKCGSLLALYWLALCAPGFTSEQGKATPALDPQAPLPSHDPKRAVTIVALQAGGNHYKNGNPGLDANFALFAGLAQQAAVSQPRPDLICFPEYAISGWSYPGEKVMNGMAEAIPGTGRWYRRYLDLARETGVPILCWLVEASQGKLYNTAFIIDGRGAFKGKYRKVHTNLGEQVWWGWSQGERFELIELDGVKYGVSICADMWFPETARCLELMGADAILHISIGSGDDDGRLIPARAYDSKIPIVATLFKGGSSAVNAKGRSLGQLVSRSPAWKAFQIHPFHTHLGRKYGGIWDMKKGQQNLRNVGAYAILTDPAARPRWTEVFMDKKGGPQTREQLLQRFGGRYDAHDKDTAGEKPQR